MTQPAPQGVARWGCSGAYTADVAWSGPLAVAAVLAVVAGFAKLLRPGPVAVALRGIGVGWGTPTMVRAGSLLEALVGAVAVGAGWTPAIVALAVSYLGFAGFVAVARTHPGIASCGCFGETEAPPSWRHVIVDVGLATGCVGAAVAGTPGIGPVLGAQPAAGIPFSAVVLLAAWLAYVVLSGPQAGALGLTRAAR
ncbi:MAG: hypothetical protein M3063_15710 [Actinomycetota bacterium]|nr:hypothetical protein [Actinomycetota bacterium]